MSILLGDCSIRVALITKIIALQIIRAEINLGLKLCPPTSALYGKYKENIIISRDRCYKK